MYKRQHKSLIIKIAGQKDNTPTKPSSTSKISETNIKLILFFLQNPESVNWAYREIQEKVGLSLGTITKAFDLLKAKQYLVQTEKGRKISMREELVEWWQQQYNEFLKPKLLINRMTFRSPEHRRKWKEMLLPEGMYWGCLLYTSGLNRKDCLPTSPDCQTQFPFQDPVRRHPLIAGNQSTTLWGGLP